MANYTDGCEECEEIQTFCIECWVELPEDLKNAELERVKRQKLKAKKAREDLIFGEGE